MPSPTPSPPTPSTPHLYPISLPSISSPPPLAPQLPTVPLPSDEPHQDAHPSEMTLHSLLDSESYSDEETHPPFQWVILHNIEDFLRPPILRQPAATPPAREMTIFFPFGEIEVKVAPKDNLFVTIGDVLRTIRNKVIQPIDPRSVKLEDEEIEAARNAVMWRATGQGSDGAVGVLGYRATLWDVLYSQDCVLFAGLSADGDRWMLHTRGSVGTPPMRAGLPL